MLVNFNNKTIHCYFCNKDYYFTEVNLHWLYEGSISCPDNHLVGNENDREWLLISAPCNYHEIYHGEEYCKCADKKCNCFGLDDNCEFPLAKQTYENDLDEEK